MKYFGLLEPTYRGFVLRYEINHPLNSLNKDLSYIERLLLS